MMMENYDLLIIWWLMNDCTMIDDQRWLMIDKSINCDDW